jgi:hypothetical protein
MSPERFVKGESERTVFNGLDSLLRYFLRNLADAQRRSMELREVLLGNTSIFTLDK